MLGVAKPSVTGALQTLKRKGLANYKPYDCVTLTASGKQAASRVVRKHNVIKSFFVNILGIDAETAQQAACKAEHAFGQKVVARLLSFIDFVTQQNKDGCDLAKQFKQFCNKGEQK